MKIVVLMMCWVMSEVTIQSERRYSDGDNNLHGDEVGGDYCERIAEDRCSLEQPAVAVLLQAIES